MEVNNVCLGADPEIFVEKADGSLFPAFEFLKGKDNPDKTEDGQSVYWDGFQAEHTIEASAKVPTCVNSLKLGLKQVIKLAKIKDKRAKLSLQTVVDTPLKDLVRLPTHLTEFGCMPSFNAYGIKGRGSEGHTVPYRFAGGHIHFGIGELSEDVMEELVKTLDTVLGIASVSMFERFDNPVRREYYGLAGEYRLPPWGLEYRTLSNAWVFNPDLATKVLELSRRVVVMGFEGRRDTWGIDDEDVMETILMSDVKKARKILSKNQGLLEEMMPGMFSIVSNPIEYSYKMDDIEANWGIK